MYLLKGTNQKLKVQISLIFEIIQ